MNTPKNIQGKFAIGFGLALVAVTIGLFFLPTLTLQLYGGYYINQYKTHQAQLADVLQPELSKTTEPALHFAYQQARTAAGQTNRLQREYQELAEQYPDESALKFYLARITGTTEWLQDIPAQDQKTPAGYAYSADHQWRHGYFLDAKTAAENLPSSWLKHYLLAEIHSRLEQPDQAKSQFQQALAQQNLPEFVRLRYAEWAHHHRQPIKETVLSQWGDDFQKHYPQIYTLQEVLSGREIQEIFNNAPISALCFPPSLNAMAWEALRQQNRTVARIALNRSEKINPNQGRVTALKAILARDEHRSDYAQRLMKSRLNNTQIDPAFHVEMADTLNAWGEKEMAAKHFFKAWGHLPDDAEMLRDYGQQLLSAGQPCRALTQFKRARRLSPAAIELQTVLAQTAETCDEIDLAIESYYDLLTQKPGDREVTDRLAELLIQQGKITPAISLYDRLLPRNPKDGSLYAAIGRIHLHFDNYQKGISYLSLMLQKYPDMKHKAEVRQVLELLREKLPGS